MNTHQYIVAESSLLQQWKKGPITNKQLKPGHGRGILCMSVNNDILATGSADHGIRLYNIQKGSYMRELFSKNYGHSEWVTTCAHLTDGRLLSGGMDSKLCLWDAQLVRCNTLKGHGGSISKVMCDQFDVAISSSYDQTLKVWDLNQMEATTLKGHRDAVLDFEWKNSLCVSGDKSGTISFWVKYLQKYYQKQ